MTSFNSVPTSYAAIIVMTMSDLRRVNYWSPEEDLEFPVIALHKMVSGTNINELAKSCWKTGPVGCALLADELSHAIEILRERDHHIPANHVSVLRDELIANYQHLQAVRAYES
ncbi:hypothetical protein K0U83_06315 [bacterium]|nr:hypothetical protein [bacterium]